MRKSIVFLLLILFVVTGCNKHDDVLLSFKQDSFIEVNTNHTIEELIGINKGTIINGDEIVNSKKVGNTKVIVKIKDQDDSIFSKTIDLNVIDTIPPVVENIRDLMVFENDSVDLFSNLEITDNSNDEVKKEIYGEYDISKEGTYNLQYVIKDQNGNETIKNFKLTVKKKNILNTADRYYIKVNKKMNVVMVYSKDAYDEYTILEKTFVSSAGNETPTGVFQTAAKYETLSLVGGVYGHYTVQINGPYWFHSVPYYSKPGSDGNWDDLEYEEYNKLGTIASKGCIRLSAIDSKWIFDNIPKGTKVEIYESDTLPEGVIKPTPIKIDVNDINKRGWDPTDPDPDNPWNK